MSVFFATEAVIPMRGAPAESAEMVSQLLFGDIVQVLEKRESWLHVRNEEDGYEGWVSANMLTELLPGESEDLSGWRYVHEPFAWVEGPDGLLRLPMGVRVPEAELFVLGGREWRQPWLLGRKRGDPGDIPALARAFRNTPYLWGGRSSFGIDCSGLAQTVFRMAGIGLPRDSGVQQRAGQEVAFAEKRAGDLAFFSKPEAERVSHVGILDENGWVIHASGKVRVDPLEAEGLRHAQTGRFTHKLVSINRYQIT